MVIYLYPHLRYTGHRRLYIDRRTPILHRDLSLQNFKCYETVKGSGDWKAVLIDYDLSIFLEEGGKSPGASSKHRTGTGPFMARELLADAPEGVMVSHVYADELESWLYILLHVQLGYTDVAPK